MVQWINSALDAMNAPQDFRLSSADQLANAEVAKNELTEILKNNRIMTPDEKNIFINFDFDNIGIFIDLLVLRISF